MNTPLYTLIHKEITRIFRTWSQTLIPPLITTSLYYLIFGQIIGSRIGTMHSLSYNVFIIAGLSALGVMVNAYANVSSSLFIEKFQKSIEGLLCAPLSAHILVIGFVSGGLFRGTIVASIITALGLLFTHLTIQHPLAYLALILFIASTFSMLGMFNALWAKKFDEISFVPTFILTPLIYLGGVFFPISLLPNPWQSLAHLNPVAWMISGLRETLFFPQLPHFIPLCIGLLLFNLSLYAGLIFCLNKRYGVRL